MQLAEPWHCAASQVRPDLTFQNDLESMGANITTNSLLIKFQPHQFMFESWIRSVSLLNQVINLFLFEALHVGASVQVPDRGPLLFLLVDLRQEVLLGKRHLGLADQSPRRLLIGMLGFQFFKVVTFIMSFLLSKE